jgi:hypothetical protein
LNYWLFVRFTKQIALGRIALKQEEFLVDKKNDGLRVVHPKTDEEDTATAQITDRRQNQRRNPNRINRRTLPDRRSAYNKIRIRPADVAAVMAKDPAAGRQKPPMPKMAEGVKIYKPQVDLGIPKTPADIPPQTKGNKSDFGGFLREFWQRLKYRR